MMKTAFLHPPSFDVFDGGVNSRNLPRWSHMTQLAIGPRSQKEKRS